MPSKSREARDEQKEYWEGQLKLRLKLLNEKGLPSEKVDKDPMVKKIKAQLRSTGRRMVVIEGRRKKIEEMARIKAEKMEGPKREGPKKKVNSEESGPSKRQLKKQMKKEGKEK